MSCGNKNEGIIEIFVRRIQIKDSVGSLEQMRKNLLEDDFRESI